MRSESVDDAIHVVEYVLTGMVLSGYAVRGGCAQPGYDEEGASGRHRDCLVGGQPLQVS